MKNMNVKMILLVAFVSLLAVSIVEASVIVNVSPEQFVKLYRDSGMQYGVFRYSLQGGTHTYLMGVNGIVVRTGSQQPLNFNSLDTAVENIQYSPRQ